MAGIESVIADQLVLSLTEFCITNAATNPADFVIVGMPGPEHQYSTVVSIHTEDPRGPRFAADAVASGKSRARWFFPNSTGGWRMLMVTGTIQVDVHVEEATPAALLAVLSDQVERVCAAINQDADLINLTDDHDNTVLVFETMDISGYNATNQFASAFQRWISWVAFVSRQDCRS